MNKLQRDVVFKALRLLAELENVELPAEVKEVAGKVAEQNPYDTDVTDIAAVMESMIDDIKQNSDYILYEAEDLVERYVKQVPSLEDLLEQLDYTEIELEISTSIELHDTLDELIDYLSVEFNMTELKEILDGEMIESLEIFHVGNDQYVTVYE